MTDRKPRVTTPPMSSRDAPFAIDIDISEAKLLILITEFGERGDVRDLADWVEARIIR
ncbi:MAG: NPCBM/NEW2 domain-containing protein [Isosphaeraceae bacterium]